MLVLANPEIANLPGWVIALVAPVGLAVALSTAAGLFLAISGAVSYCAVSYNVVKGTLAPKISSSANLHEFLLDILLQHASE